MTANPAQSVCYVCGHPVSEAAAVICESCNSPVHRDCTASVDDSITDKQGRAIFASEPKTLCNKCRLSRLEGLVPRQAFLAKSATGSEEKSELASIQGDLARLEENLNQRLDELAKRLDAAGASRLTSQKMGTIRKLHWLYPILFAAAVLGVAALVSAQLAEKATVSISFNVGEIIGGVLLGISAIWAAIVYTRR